MSNTDASSVTAASPPPSEVAGAAFRPTQHARLLSNNLPDPETRQIARAFRRELDALIARVPDPARRDAFAKNMREFHRIFLRFLDAKSRGLRGIDWDKIASPGPDLIHDYAALAEPADAAAARAQLSRLAVLKLNGGLGTTMGCVGPKSVIEVRDGQTFLDLTVDQIEHLNASLADADVRVPLVLMNSFNTDRDTRRVIGRYSGDRDVDIYTFEQSMYPRISASSNLPIPRDPPADVNGVNGVADPAAWYPPGHGDLFSALHGSGLLDQLIAMGKEFLFVSNVDNLGATVDPRILNQLAADDACEFIMEVTDKTRADVKGGTLIDYAGRVRLLEIAQVPPEHVDEFKSVKKFRIFNTNNLWIRLSAIKRVVERGELDLEIIVNKKSMPSGKKVLQLETAVGAAIKHFRGAHGVRVPRSRFLPVKSTSDLFLVTSDLYTMAHGMLRMNPRRTFAGPPPLVKLGEEFRTVGDFAERFRGRPRILELDHLTVTGDVTFGSGVELRGTVIIVANHGSRIDIPTGAVLENKVVSGNLRILDH